MATTGNSRTERDHSESHGNGNGRGTDRDNGREVSTRHRDETGSTETKSAFKTTEFVAFVLVFACILIAAAIIGGGDDRADDFVGRQAWLYVTILTSAYFIGRGLAKSGSVEIYRGDEGNQLRR